MVNTRHFLSFYVRFGCQLKDIQNTPDLPLKYSLQKLQRPVCPPPELQNLIMVIMFAN